MRALAHVPCWVVLGLLFITTPATAYDGPVIDMHFHAWPSGENGGPELAKNQATRDSALRSLIDNNVVLAATSGPEDSADRPI